MHSRRDAVISYEYPLNERIRTLLRLEDLYARFEHFRSSDGPLEHHTALLILFDILEVAGRAELKVDLMQELERQRQFLIGFRNNPDISEQALNEALGEIEQASGALRAMSGKIGQHLRENEWLMAIRSRASIPGGVCQFDLPSYHAWLHRELATRRHDLDRWAAPLLPLRDGALILLRLLRASGGSEQMLARGGNYQHMMNSGRPAQMVRVRIDSTQVIPEISANKYALNIRFRVPDTAGRAAATDRDIPFELTFFNL